MVQSYSSRIAKHISRCIQLGILLEVSISKPGNISREAAFENTRYEHFLASAVAVAPSFELAAERGQNVAQEKIPVNQIEIGSVIKDAVQAVNTWQRGGNTLLGAILLLSPIAAATGITLSKSRKLQFPKLRENLRDIIRSTTYKDAIAVYEAINIANPNGLKGKAPTLDVYDPKSIHEIQKQKISLYDIFKISAPYDTISLEWINNFSTTFEIGLPSFNAEIKKTDNLDIAVIHTFLKILSKIPDTLISRKTSIKKAREVSERAERVLKLGGLKTLQGRQELSELDKNLRSTSNQYNPGTTADIISVVLSLAVLNGYRP